jgi:hypothetical protein
MTFTGRPSRALRHDDDHRGFAHTSGFQVFSEPDGRQAGAVQGSEVDAGRRTRLARIVEETDCLEVAVEDLDLGLGASPVVEEGSANAVELGCGQADPA